LTMNSQMSVDRTRLTSALVRWFAELTHHGMFATDREFRVVFWNRWMEIHTDRSAADVVGRSILDLYPDLVIRSMDQYYQDALSGRISVISHGLHRYILRLPRTNPDIGLDEMPQSGRIGPLSEGEEVIGTVTTIDDISERLSSEAELRKQIEVQRIARTAAEQALRAKDDFLSTVSHEMRNPLSAVLGWTRVLIDRKGVDSEVLARALHVIERNATAQVRMIDDLLDVARIASGKLRLEMQRIDLLGVVATAIDVVAPAAKAKQIEIRSSLDAMTPAILGDPQRLQQILSNLLSNAVKFTDAGGLVTVRVGPVGRAIRIVITDTGHGISKEFLPFVFERFRQSDASSARRHGGLGLGLALVRELVELHGGTVKAESEGEGHGASFTIELPTGTIPQSRHDAGQAGTMAPTGARALAGVRVLVVEDEADCRDLLAEALGAFGADVTSASTCDEALNHIRRSAPALPDVILSDLGMPASDGFDLIQRLRTLDAEAGGRIPAIAVTGYANSEDRHRALAAGYDGHLAKPIDPSAIASAIARALLKTDG